MKMRKSVVALIFLFAANKMCAQPGNPGVQLANHIANKMKDTLSLTTQQRNRVFATNMYLHNRKTAIRQQTVNPDTLRIKLQREEKKRDSMYRRVLPEAKYQLYLQKKRNLVSSN